MTVGTGVHAEDTCLGANYVHQKQSDAPSRMNRAPLV